jgi:hypothetical protein
MAQYGGRIQKGERRSPGTEFQPGQHWREPKPYWNRGWLDRAYTENGRSAGDIAAEFGVRDTAIFHWLKKHGIPRRTTGETRAAKRWGVSGVDNPMWNRRGELNPNWRGGFTPERQTFYTSDAWRSACSRVWKRDEARCRRCGLRHRDQADMPMHVHHVAPFAVVERRADPDNLVLLCEVCHRFVHSRGNTDREFLPGKEV